jgi:hypothetical protein
MDEGTRYLQIRVGSGVRDNDLDIIMSKAKNVQNEGPL